MFRPQIKVVDCTIRDGGLANDSHFTFETVKAVYQAACAAGLDYVELGYRNSKEMFDPAEFGPWRFCDEDLLAKVVEGVDPRGTKICLMQDAHKASADDVLERDHSVVDMFRIATYVRDIDKAIKLANNATEKGYDCAVNIMAISHEGDQFLDEALQQIESETKALAVYVVDSFGALYSEVVDFYVEKFQKYIKTKEVGVHMHNNQQLAFANTIQGIIKGANYLDGTLFGLGRGAGNCPTELLLSFLKNPKFDIRPLLKVIPEHIMPMQQSIDWGYHIPYMLTGILDVHPQVAMQHMAGENKTDFVGFYNKVYDMPSL